ncbi:MAG: hypothetical protein Q8M31_04000 [Beijerinckiaceae bacterium]|nr:hypothetical protein [Beijerinckiaceae bacterium]
MNAHVPDPTHQAAAEVYQAAADATFYLERLRDYLEQGDATGAKRSRIMADGAFIRLQAHWLTFESLLPSKEGRQ